MEVQTKKIQRIKLSAITARYLRPVFLRQNDLTQADMATQILKKMKG